MFKKRYTKWLPLGSFGFDGTDFIVFVRRNLKTNMLSFKNKAVNQRLGSCNNTIIPYDLIDVREAWKKITEE